MAELGIIASVAQIADIGLRLSIRLYTFGEIVASADRSVISISKDVSLTSGVLKELGQILDKDKETRTFSQNAVETADGVVRECLEVFQEMESILVKKLPSLAGGGKEGKGAERAKRATVMLERLKWGYLQPKLQLLRSNLDRLKSTLLLMLNVITYARQVSDKIESPSVIAEQRSLIEDLALSNEEYVREFERLKLGIDGPATEHVDDASNTGGVKRGPSTTAKPLAGAPTHAVKKLRCATGGTPLQDRENIRGRGYEALTTATAPLPEAQNSMTRSLMFPPNAGTNNGFINTSVQPKITLPPLQRRGVPSTQAPMGSEQVVLFKQLEHYSMLIKKLLKEVDETQYKTTFDSRLRMKNGIADLREGEKRELEKVWGCTALRSAEQRLDSLVGALGELPVTNRFAASVPTANSLTNLHYQIRTSHHYRQHSSKLAATDAQQHRGTGSGGSFPTLKTSFYSQASRTQFQAQPRPQNAENIHGGLQKRLSFVNTTEEQRDTPSKQITNPAALNQLALQQQNVATCKFTATDEPVEPCGRPSNGHPNYLDILGNFDFEEFLKNTDGDFNFDPAALPSELEDSDRSNAFQSPNHIEDRVASDKRGMNHEYKLDGYEKQLADLNAKNDGDSVKKYGNKRMILEVRPAGRKQQKNTTTPADMKSRTLGRKNVKGLALSAAPKVHCPKGGAPCQRCRTAKVRCDGKVPVCTACEKAGAKCSPRNTRRRDAGVEHTNLPDPVIHSRVPSNKQLDKAQPCVAAPPLQRASYRDSGDGERASMTPSGSTVESHLKEGGRGEDWELVGMEVVDRLVCLWTTSTVKPL